MTSLALARPAPMAVERIRSLEQAARRQQQEEVRTTHVIHAGVYSRTVLIPAGLVMTGASIKCATQIIVSGHVTVATGEATFELAGYHVLPASAGRKTAFLAHEDTWLTMLFASGAETVEAAEDEFTDEGNLLMSRAFPESNTIIITGG